MKCDFSRDTFDPRRRYSRVLMQQGRVLLDADFNEQVAIQLHELRQRARDLIGPVGGPKGNLGFGVSKGANLRSGDFALSPGNYYVNGVLARNPADASFLGQADLPGARPLDGGNFIAYLDVWEREVTAVQRPELREAALGGADTSARSEVVWQVRVAKVPETVSLPDQDAALKYYTDTLQPELVPTGKLRVRAMPVAMDDGQDPCHVPPEARYRGFENQLYRVEIHTDTKGQGHTFKWSRDNGSVVFPVTSLAVADGKVQVAVTHLGRDDRSGLAPGDWVEIADDDSALGAVNDGLFVVTQVDRASRTVTLRGHSATTIGQHPAKHPLLRRWDRPAGSAVKQPSGGALKTGSWIDLEDGVQVMFVDDGPGGTRPFRKGDYWLIPARTATGDVEWPRDPAQPDTALALPRHGVQHHHAPLALVHTNNTGIDKVIDLRSQFDKLSTLMPVSP
jgi:hypothetical protein